MATLNGVNIFGNAVVMVTGDDARETQKNTYFGLTGVESLDGGGRGRVTNATGTLYGANLSALNVAIALIRSYIDGLGYTLVDTRGRTFTNVRLVAFKETDRCVPYGSGYIQAYAAVLEHLA